MYHRYRTYIPFLPHIYIISTEHIYQFYSEPRSARFAPPENTTLPLLIILSPSMAPRLAHAQRTQLCDMIMSAPYLISILLELSTVVYAP